MHEATDFVAMLVEGEAAQQAVCSVLLTYEIALGGRLPCLCPGLLTCVRANLHVSQVIDARAEQLQPSEMNLTVETAEEPAAPTAVEL